MFSRVVWAWSNLDSCLNFTGRDLHLKSAKFGLVKFGVASLASLRKKQPLEVVFYFVVKGLEA